MVLVTIIIALSLSARSLNQYYVRSRLDPAVELQKALENMDTVNSYRFSLHSGFTVDERREVISEVEGEREKGNTHIKGEMVNTPIDIYYLDQVIYNYDSFSDKWLVIDSGTSNSEELLIAELNPLSNLKFKKNNQVEKLRFEDVNGTDCLVVKCNPVVESQLLDSLWKNFQYTIWIDYAHSTICKADLTAIGKNNESTNLQINLVFSDIGSKIEIEAPLRSSSKKQ